MDYESYRANYFVDPPPAPRFEFDGLKGVTLFYEDYEAAVAFYTEVLGPPAYVEGAGTRGWPLGATWLTLLQGRAGAPSNVEVSLIMPSAEEAERLQQAFMAAGANGAPPADQLMYRPIRACPVTDPFGVDLLIFSPIDE